MAFLNRNTKEFRYLNILKLLYFSLVRPKLKIRAQFGLLITHV